MQAFEFLSPLPHFNNSRFRAYWGDVLRLLHVFLLSHEAYSESYYSLQRAT